MGLTQLVRRLPAHGLGAPPCCPPRRLVLGEFLFYINPILSTDAVRQLPDNSFFLRTVPLIQDTLDRLSRNNFSVTLSIIDSTAVNLHTIEDQLLTAVIQLCPKLTASRVCFGTPSRHPERPQPASQPVQNPPIYSPRASEVTHSPRRRRSGGAQPRSQAAKKPAKRRKFGGNHRQQTAKHHHHRCLDNVQVRSAQAT